MASLDIFADTNPAYCSRILMEFCWGYEEEAGSGVPFPLIILPLPIVLSGDHEAMFDGTNKATGLFTWIDRNPELLLDLSERVEG